MFSVTIQGAKFRGFQLQARLLVGGPHRVGSFVQPIPRSVKFLSCDAHDPFSTLTHNDSCEKQNLSFYWLPPENDVGPVVLL